MRKGLHDFFIAEQYHSPSTLEDIHRREQETLDKARVLAQRPQTGPSNSVLAIRKQASLSKMKGPPSMQSLYHGQATFLDYKRRTKPV